MCWCWGVRRMKNVTMNTFTRSVGLSKGVCWSLLCLSFQHTHSSRPSTPQRPFVFQRAKMCLLPSARKRKKRDLPCFLSSLCESDHILKLNPNMSKSGLLKGRFKGRETLSNCSGRKRKAQKQKTGLWARKVTNGKHLVVKMFLIRVIDFLFELSLLNSDWWVYSLVLCLTSHRDLTSMC